MSRSTPVTTWVDSLAVTILWSSVVLAASFLWIVVFRPFVIGVVPDILYMELLACCVVAGLPCPAAYVHRSWKVFVVMAVAGVFLSGAGMILALLDALGHVNWMRDG